MRVRVFAGDDFHGLRHFQRFVDGVGVAVDFGADAVVADFGVDGVGVIDRGGMARQVDDFAFRRVDVHVAGDDFFFDGVVELERVVGVVLHFF